MKCTFKDNSEMNYSSLAKSNTFNKSLIMDATFSGVAIKYSKSKAMILMSKSFSYRHYIIVLLYLRATAISCLAINPRLNNERYFELESLTETNLVNTFSVYVLRVGFGGIVMKHWKHSNKIALAPFLMLPLLVLAQTPSCEVTRISP